MCQLSCWRQIAAEDRGSSWAAWLSLQSELGVHDEKPNVYQLGKLWLARSQEMILSETTHLKTELVTSQVADALRQWILMGKLAGGEHVGQDTIAEELGVSRVPVREALLMLEAEGLIVRKKYKGAFVAEISLEELHETYQLRVLLEGHLFEKSLPLIKEDDLRRAEEIIRQSDAAATNDEWMRLNIEFHLTLYRPANLPVTMQTLRSMLNRTDRYFRLQQVISPTVRDESRNQHQHIIDVIRSGDRQAALVLMRQHIQGNEADVLRYLNNQILRPVANDLPLAES